jgi:hypothetical protein
LGSFGENNFLGELESPGMRIQKATAGFGPSRLRASGKDVGFENGAAADHLTILSTVSWLCRQGTGGCGKYFQQVRDENLPGIAVNRPRQVGAKGDENGFRKG